MRLIRKQTGQHHISFVNGIGDDVRIRLDTALRMSELLAEQKEKGNDAGFSPWINWNLPFMRREAAIPPKTSGSLLITETVSFLNNAYQILNSFDNTISIHNIHVKVREIVPNPFWDMESSRMLISRIKFWAIIINEIDITHYPCCIMGIRINGGEYQAINHHHQLAALRLLGVETVLASIIDLSDTQMKRKLNFERV